MDRQAILSKRHKTRPIVSRFEFARLVVELALHLEHVSDVGEYLSTPQVAGVINPCELAFNYILLNKENFFVRRGAEKVYLSEVFMIQADLDYVKKYYADIKSRATKGVTLRSDANDEIGEDAEESEEDDLMEEDEEMDEDDEDDADV